MLCGFIIGSSAEATDSWTWTSCPGVRASCGFSCECVLLAAPFALNHVSHLISHLISHPFYHPPASFCLLLLPSPAPPPSLSLLPLIAVRLSHFAPPPRSRVRWLQTADFLSLPQLCWIMQQPCKRIQRTAEGRARLIRGQDPLLLGWGQCRLCMGSALKISANFQIRYRFFIHYVSEKRKKATL